MSLSTRRFRPVALLALLALGGCSGADAANALGIGRNPPDEFAVVDRPPLSMPPDFALRPPQPGAARPQEVSMPARAQETLFGANAPAAKAEESDGEKALLKEAGAAKAEPGIRQLIDRETAQRVVGSKRLVDEILWWRKDASSATTVDAPAEAQRLKETKDKGGSVTTGATPIIEKDKSGWLGL